ncbi:MAG: hypothetical protein KDJ29_06195 [Hyphomicrobiales bacterium]|nr:hypothetical protein [Hyphomicrobiales bacterium]
MVKGICGAPLSLRAVVPAGNIRETLAGRHFAFYKAARQVQPNPPTAVFPIQRSTGRGGKQEIVARPGPVEWTENSAHCRDQTDSEFRKTTFIHHNPCRSAQQQHGKKIQKIDFPLFPPRRPGARPGHGRIPDLAGKD